MKTNYKFYLTVTILISLFLLEAQCTGSKPLVAIALACFVGLIAFSKKCVIFPILTYFLAWSPILRFDPSGTTMFTLVVIVLLVRIFFDKSGSNSRGSFSFKTVFFTSIIAGVTFAVKFLSNIRLDNTYYKTLLMLFVFPEFVKSQRKELSFGWITAFISIGTAIPGYSAIFLGDNPNLKKFITVDMIGTSERHSGFTSDPNTYAVFVLVAIACIIIYNIKENKNTLISYVGIAVLTYIGLTSVSKMFVLVIVAIFVLWVIKLIKIRGVGILKNVIIGILIVSVVAVVYRESFEKYLVMYSDRFEDSTDLKSFTTNRSTILVKYINMFKENPLLMWKGQGLSSKVLPLNVAAHNTLIELIYQMGFFVMWLFWLWYKAFKNEYLQGVNLKGKGIERMILWLTCFASMLGLDLLFKDGFFYFICLYLIGLYYVCTENNEENQIEKNSNCGQEVSL